MYWLKKTHNVINTQLLRQNVVVTQWLCAYYMLILDLFMQVAISFAIFIIVI